MRGQEWRQLAEPPRNKREQYVNEAMQWKVETGKALKDHLAQPAKMTDQKTKASLKMEITNPWSRGQRAVEEGPQIQEARPPASGRPQRSTTQWFWSPQKQLTRMVSLLL